MATGYTLLRQDEDIRKSEAYTDSTAPSEAAFETNPTDIEDDLNNLRSQVNNLLKEQTGNWYDDLLTPATFESGAKRGVNSLNQDLHDLEKKRVLKWVCSLADIVVPSSAKATGALDLTGGDFANGETFTVGTRTYTMESVFSDTADYILIEAAATDTIDNIIAALTNGAGEGTKYGTGTAVNADITATAGAGDTMDAEALVAGTAGNLIATTVSATNPVWGAATLSGGAGDLVILGAGELPSNTIAAVGAVSTLGTVVAYEADFGTATTTEVVGTNAINPKNLLNIVDADTRDPIVDSDDKRIYGLLQSETVTDGHTITDTTPTRVQISFVVINDEGNDLEVVAAGDIGGLDINYCCRERSYLEGLNEQDFLGGADVDVPAGTTVTRQVAYNNQGTSPVEVTTNSTLDLNSAGIYWELRDLLNATLLRVTEGSGGGTSTVLVGGDVDVFDVNAVDNDFLNGATFGTTGTGIQIAETAGVIERAADLILRASGAGELYLDDSNQPVSWAQTDGVKLSDTATEWSDYETAFGSEVSLLNAITQAYYAGGDPTRTWHEVTAAAITANNDVSGPSGANNVDTDFPDLSTGSFLTNHWLFLNGRLMRPGADAAANYDYYPGTALTPDADLRFERVLRSGDIISVVVWPNDVP